MKKSILVATLVSFSIVGLSTSSFGDSERGQVIYKKKLRKACRFSGVKFATHHTVEEWEEINSNGKLPEEVKKICPTIELEQIKPEWWPDIYDFVHEYGVGGSHVPKC